MTGTASTEGITCKRCHRALRSAASVAAGIGPRCAAIEAATEGLSAKQVDKMAQLIIDKAIVSTNRKGVYHVVNEAGEVVHVTHVNGHCGCEWSRRRMTADVKVCYHVGAARLLARPLIRKHALVVLAAAPIALPAPAALWAEMDRLSDAFMAAA
jgi:Family of unknown function (DUF6011)